MKKSLSFISLMLIGICAFGQLVAPTFTVDNSNNTTIYITINDTNGSETGFEIEVSGSGPTVTKPVSLTGTTVFTSANGLMPSTTYSLRVRAVIGASFGPYSPSVSGRTAIDVPPAPVLKVVENCPTKVLLNWDVNERTGDIDYFLVQRSFSGPGGPFETIGTKPPQDRFQYDGEAIADRTIFYRVTAVNVSGLRASNVVTQLVKGYRAPPAPANVFSDQKQKSRNFLTIKWDNLSWDYACRSNVNIGNFVMYKLASETEYKLYEQVYPEQGFIKIDGLKPKDIVDYRIFSYSDVGLQSAWVGGRDTTWGPSFAPKNLIGVAYKDVLGNSAIDVKWTDGSNDEDYFTLDVSTDSSTYKQLGKVIFNQTTIKHAPIEEGVKYFYRVKSGSNTDGESPYIYSNGAVLFAYSIAPNAPIGLNGKINGAKVDLTWRDDSDREAEFIVEKSTDKGLKYTQLAKLPRNATSYSDAAVPKAGETVLYKVKAANPKGESASSNVLEIAVPVAKVGSIIDQTLSVYPNPTTDLVNIKIATEIIGKSGKISILNENNQLVYEKSIDNYSEEIKVPMSQLSEGMFKIVIESNDFKETKKVYKIK